MQCILNHFSVFSDPLLKHSLLFKASRLVKKAPSNLEFSSNCVRELSELGPAGPALGGRTHHGKATTLKPFCTSPLPRSGLLFTFSTQSMTPHQGGYCTLLVFLTANSPSQSWPLKAFWADTVPFMNPQPCYMHCFKSYHHHVCVARYRVPC